MSLYRSRFWLETMSERTVRIRSKSNTETRGADQEGNDYAGPGKDRKSSRRRKRESKIARRGDQYDLKSVQ